MQSAEGTSSLGRSPRWPRTRAAGPGDSQAAIMTSSGSRTSTVDEVVRSNAAAAQVARGDTASGDMAAGEPEALILVDAADRVVGRLSNSSCHEGNGVLHRAFSLLIFN